MKGSNISLLLLDTRELTQRKVHRIALVRGNVPEFNQPHQSTLWKEIYAEDEYGP